jgi:multidrug efflux system outer membrane protein
MKPAHSGAVILLSAILTACAVGPSYEQPAAPDAVARADSFINAQDPVYRHEPDATRFWTVFQDPMLTKLVDDALASNHDIRIAAARLAEARALRRDAAFDLGPTIETRGSYTENRISAAERPDLPASARDINLYDAGFDATWELDVFGRVRRGVEAQTAEVGSAYASLQDAFVTLTSEVARNYFELRGFQQRYDVARQNADNQTQSLKLTQVRLDAGRGTDLDVARAQAQLSATLSTLPQLETEIARAQYRLAVLTGRTPGALAAELAPRPLPELPAFTPVGDPSDWLRRRPDIRVAERNLAAATARIGIAVGDLFPKVTLLGSFGWSATDSGGIGNSDTESYRFGPSISWAIFDLGHVQARIAAANARADGALATYEQTVLRALEDTEGSLVAYSRALQSEAALEQAAEASATAARLARLRFDEGVSDFLQVLDAERTKLEAEDRLAQGRAAAATSLVAVYKALGAGWQDIESPYLPVASN